MSTLREALVQYVAVRRALGTQLTEPAKTLGQFVSFLEREQSLHITTELALRWSMAPQGVQRATWARRLSMVRQFAKWLNASDPKTEVPPHRLILGRRRRNKPHIFTDGEVVRLMAEAGRLQSSTGLRSLTYMTLIGLLASTGLRPGEALALDKSNVDLENGILSIRQTKFGKSRFVPLDPSTCTALQEYAERRDELCLQPRSPAFLLSERGRRLLGGPVRRTFASISSSIGLRPPMIGKRCGRGPRLQDFRHSFATKRLVEWYRAGLDVDRELPKLSTYLGHVEIGLTYWYIEAIPELLALARKRLGTVHVPGGEQ